MEHMIVSLSDRPDLAPLVAKWLVDAFPHPASPTIEETVASLLAPHRGPEEIFVLFDRDTPVGTASLAYDDLPSRPDLTPWLASAFVVPGARGRGYAAALVRRVEAFATAASVQTPWLFTWTAEPLYARLGWQRAGLETNRGQEVVLMRRDISGG